MNVRNTMQKNENIFFFFKVGASDSASGHMTVNNIIEMELFSHDSLDAARDFWPNSQSLILILKDYHYNAEKIISKEDISKLSLIEDEIKVLVNESSHYYLVKRFTKGGDLWKIDPITNCPTNITNDANFWKRLSLKNLLFTEVYELKTQNERIEE